MSFGQCPKCETILNNVNLEGIDVYVNHQPQWNGVAYLCPFCNSILSVGIDPIALKTDIVDDLLRKLRDR